MEMVTMTAWNKNSWTFQQETDTNKPVQIFHESAYLLDFLIPETNWKQASNTVVETFCDILEKSEKLNEIKVLINNASQEKQTIGLWQWQHKEWTIQLTQDEGQIFSNYECIFVINNPHISRDDMAKVINTIVEIFSYETITAQLGLIHKYEATG